MSEPKKSFPKWLWIDQVACDRELPPSALRVAVVLASYANGSSGVAFPSIDRLAEILGIVPNCVRKAVRAMAAAGHLDVDVGGGRKACNTYRLIAKADHVESSKRFTDVQRYEEKPCTDVHETLHGRSQNPAQAFTKPCTPVRPNTIRNTTKEHQEGTHLIAREGDVIPFSREADRFNPPTRQRRGQLPIPLDGGTGKPDPDHFSEFWLIFPKRQGRHEAKEAFRAALRHATAEEIVAGAQRYAAVMEADRRDPAEKERFTKTAANWLKGRHWLDEHAPPRPRGEGRAMTYARQLLEAGYGE
jgi:hypothetical protein